MLHDIKNVGRKCGKTFFFGQNVVEEKKSLCKLDSKRFQCRSGYFHLGENIHVY